MLLILICVLACGIFMQIICRVVVRVSHDSHNLFTLLCQEVLDDFCLHILLAITVGVFIGFFINGKIIDICEKEPIKKEYQLAKIDKNGNESGTMEGYYVVLSYSIGEKYYTFVTIEKEKDNANIQQIQSKYVYVGDGNNVIKKTQLSCDIDKAVFKTTDDEPYCAHEYMKPKNKIISVLTCAPSLEDEHWTFYLPEEEGHNKWE